MKEERPLGTHWCPERPFPKFPARCARGRPERDLSCFFRLIREIVVRPSRGAMMPECKVVSGSFAVQICTIVVPTGSGKMISKQGHRPTRISDDRSLDDAELLAHRLERR